MTRPAPVRRLEATDKTVTENRKVTKQVNTQIGASKRLPSANTTTTNTSTSDSQFREFKFDTLRNISCAPDRKNDRKILTGHCPVSSILAFSTNKNVRDYLVDPEGKKRKRDTQVHRAIAKTLRDNAEDFNVLNGGVTLVTHSIAVDETTKTAQLVTPSIINGSQTQGVIRDIFKECKESGIDPNEAYIRYDIIVTRDEGLITETAISRNFQNDVAPMAILGRRGKFDELETALQKEFPGLKLQKRQTDLGDQFVSPENLLQVLWALAPGQLLLEEKEPENPNKVYTYSQRSRCLKAFDNVYNRAHDETDPEYAKYRELYQFMLDLTPAAFKLYQNWHAHQEFKGTGLRSLERHDDNSIKRVPDGILFPILAAHSAFMKKDGGRWKMDVPTTISDGEMIKSAKTAYMEIADSNPNVMGKSKACYTQLLDLAKLHRKFADMSK
jgi:hypothetical protein